MLRPSFTSDSVQLSYHHVINKKPRQDASTSRHDVSWFTQQNAALLHHSCLDCVVHSGTCSAVRGNVYLQCRGL